MREQAEQLIMVPLADIAIGKRVGFFHDVHAEALAASFAEVGQIDPVHVALSAEGAAQPWTLIAGRHRIAAAQRCGWATVEAKVVADAAASADALLRLELSENLDHRQPRPIERAIFIEARARLDDPEPHGLPPHARATKARHKSPAVIVTAGDWIEKTASSLGISPATMGRYRAIHREIVEPFADLAEALNACPLCASFSVVLRIAKLGNKVIRRRVIETIIAQPELDTLDKVLAAAGVGASKGERGKEEQVLRRTYKSAWHRMTVHVQRAELTMLIPDMKPSVAQAAFDALKRRGDCQ